MLVGPRLILALINEFEWTHGTQYDKSNTWYFLWNTGSRKQKASEMLKSDLCTPPPGTVEIPINSKANEQTNEQKLFCYINRSHKGAHALHNQRWHTHLCCSPQSLPLCTESAATTGTERRWHPGSLLPRSAWKRSSIAFVPSVSGTRSRRLWSSCTLPAFTRTVSDLHLWSSSLLLTHRGEPARQR